MIYVGDYRPNDTVRFSFNTQDGGVPSTLGGSPVVSVYKDGNTTEVTTGVTLTVDYDSRTGLNDVVIDLSSSTSTYSPGSDFRVVITTGTVNGQSVVGTCVGQFSILNRSTAGPLLSVVSASASTTFVSDRTETTDDYWKDCLLLVLTGTKAGQVKKVSAYTGSTKTFVVSGGFTATLTAGDRLMIIDR